MDISKLALLCDIADTKNLTASAERMGYTQSGVSHAISKLETELGISMLKRTKRGVELTSDGEMLMPYIRLVISHYNRMDEIVDSILGLQRGSICIGTYCSVASQWLPPIILAISANVSQHYHPHPRGRNARYRTMAYGRTN